MEGTRDINLEIVHYSCIVDVSDKAFVIFVTIPKGYSLKRFKLSDHTVTKIGKFNNFNRIKMLTTWRKQYKDLSSEFKNRLEEREWDFERDPNPTAFICVRKNKKAT